jgi:hypothetical protein
MSRKIRYGMVGGGRGAFIGAVHRIAANMDGQIELVSEPSPRILKGRRLPGPTCSWNPPDATVLSRK